MKITLIMMLLGAFALIGTLNTMAFADPGNTEITDISEPQGGIIFEVIDPNGIQQIVLPLEDPDVVDDVDPECDDNITSFSRLWVKDGQSHLDFKNPTEVTITDCQSPPSSSLWEVFADFGPNPR